MGGGGTWATPPARKEPIRWRSAAGSAINNNGLKIHGSSLASGTGSPGLLRSSALSRLLWIPVRLWPQRKALETVAPLSGFAHWQCTHVVVPCSGCTLTKSCSDGTHPSPGSLKVDARGALTRLWASNVCPGRLHFSGEAQSGFVINHALSRRVWSARSARSHFDVSTMFHLRKTFK